MKTLILCDFDGTISIRDMGYVLLNRFSSGDWDAIDRAFVEGKIGSKEAYTRITKILKDVRRMFSASSGTTPTLILTSPPFISTAAVRESTSRS